MEAERLSVIACPAPLRPAALRVLHDGLPQDQRSALVEALDRTGLSDGAAWEGLLIAANPSGAAASPAVGATWVQRAPGNTAVVWPPSASCAAADELLRSAAQWCDGQSIPLAQLSANADDGYASQRLAACGFAWLADLVYLYADVLGTSPAPEPRGGAVTLVAHAGDDPQRLGDLIEQSYIDTLDCPGLDGLRLTRDVLAGYTSQGRHIPEHWYFVQSGGADVGVLILADHPAAENCELVYMGVIPAARGGGLGAFVVRRALGIASALGARRLVLAVDADNRPALALYRRAGFIEWGRRTVYARRRRRST